MLFLHFGKQCTTLQFDVIAAAVFQLEVMFAVSRVVGGVAGIIKNQCVFGRQFRLLDRLEDVVRRDFVHVHHDQLKPGGRNVFLEQTFHVFIVRNQIGSETRSTIVGDDNMDHRFGG